jgi:hypothetical protein
MSDPTIDHPWDRSLKAKNRSAAYFQIIAKADEIPFLSMLTKEAQRGLVQMIVEKLAVEDE